MSTGDSTPSRAVLIAVACSSIAAALSLTNYASSLLGFPRGALSIPSPFAAGFRPADAMLAMAVAGVLAGALGLLVIHRAPGFGWTWLLGAGTVLTATLVLPLFDSPPSRNLLDSTWFHAAIGAGPVLVLLGLLGAANWLMRSAMAIGATVAGLALTAPILGTLVLTMILAREPSFDAFRVLNVTLAIIAIAGAVGTMILVRAGSGPLSPRPTTMATVLGVVAVALQLAPAIAERFARAQPENAFGVSLGEQDQWALLIGLCGLAMFAVAVSLVVALGVKTLGATLATGLVLYGVELPVVLGRLNVNSSAGVVMLLGLGLAIGVAGALSPWRAWVAGAACTVAGIAVVLTVADGRPSEAVGAGVLLFGVVAAVTTFASAAEAVADDAQAPAMLGAVAVAIQLGLTLSGALLGHSAFVTTGSTFQPLALASGIALLVGALLVVAVRLTRVPVVPPPDQAIVSPELPVAR